MIDIDIINRTKKSLLKTFARLNISISDNSYFSLLVHISLSIERLRQDKKIDFNEDLVKNLRSSQDYELAKQIINDLEEEFAIKIPDIEIYFVAMHIKGTKIVDDKNESFDIVERNKALAITNKLIEKMSDLYGLNIKEDLKLHHDLKAHILPALTRLNYSLTIKNPILNEIRQKYGQIYKSLKEIAPEIIRREGSIGYDIDIPDDEIGYIAIHFITAIESKIGEEVGVNILTVCPTGYGTSRLLATKLENRYSNVNIVNNASIMKLNREFLEANDVDLIVSTVKIDSLMEDDEIKDYAYIEIPDLADEDDYLKLSNKLKEISRKKYYEPIRDQKGINQAKKVEKSNVVLAKDIFEASINLNKVYEKAKYFKITKEDDPYEKSASEIGRAHV